MGTAPDEWSVTPRSMVGRQPAATHLHLESRPYEHRLGQHRARTRRSASTTEIVGFRWPRPSAGTRRGAAADRARPVVATAQGMSLFGEHAAGWLALGLLGALVDRTRRATGSPRPPGSPWRGASIAVKRAVRRPRPTDRVRCGRHPSQLGFPSAHATSTTAAAVLFGLLEHRLAPVLVPPMALSRWSWECTTRQTWPQAPSWGPGSPQCRSLSAAFSEGPRDDRHRRSRRTGRPGPDAARGRPRRPETIRRGSG